MRRTLAIVGALACAFAASAAEYTRQGGTADFACCSTPDCAPGTVLTQRAREWSAKDDCVALTDADGVQRYVRQWPMRVYKSGGTTPAPPTCPAAPASTTRPQDCPAGSTGTWTQTSTSTVGAPPACAVSTTWSPSSPPAGACNRPPTITGTPTAAVVAGAPYSFVPVAADPDADSLAFTIVNRPTWATFNAATGALTGTPAIANVGITSSIVITVSDGKASASTSAFSITVTAPPPAPTLPAPGGISATTSPNATNPANHNVALSWLTVAGATGYAIERCTGATCTNNFLPLGSVVNRTTFTDPNLPPGFTYRYRFQATPNGAWSALRNVTTPTATTPPPPPAGTGIARLSWGWEGKPPLDTDGNPVTIAGYRFLYSTVGDAGPSLSQVLNLGPVLAHEFTGLASGRWAFTIIAIDTQGRTSQQSNLAYRDVP